MIEKRMNSVLEEPVSSAVMSRYSNIVWGAVFAGVVLAMVIELTLGLLGSGLGLSTINVAEGGNLKALSIGALFWWILSAMVAFYIGGMISGRLANIPRRTDGMIHGLVTWAVSTIIMLFLLTSTVGLVIAGSFSFLKGTGEMAAPIIGDAMNAALPEETRNDIQRIWDQRGTGEDITQPLMTSLIAMASSDSPDIRREEIVNLMTSNTNLSDNEARNFVRRWEMSMPEIKQKAQDAAQAASKATGKGALASFVMLALTGFMAALGGSVGSPHWSEQEII
jgi:hypothetical protein